jgi:hypothetical protein
LIYQEQTEDSEASAFNKVVSRETAEAQGASSRYGPGQLANPGPMGYVVPPVLTGACSNERLLP